MADDLFFGEFEFNGHVYEVIEEDYLVDGIEDLTNLDEAIQAAKHAAIQRMSMTGNLATNISDMRGDYHFSNDPIDWEGTVLVVDGNNTAHRARHSYELSYKQYDTSVSYGFLSILAANIRRFERVSSVIVCWDGGVPQFRYDRLPGYKRRDHSEEEWYPEFLRQIKELHEILPQFGVYSMRKAKTEADDLMYHAARMVSHDYHKILMTTDKDLLQAIRFDTSVWQPSQEVLITPKNFEETTGVKQSDYLVYRSMVGDSSDKVDGIKGIGDKTAVKLIEQYGASPSNLVNVASGLNATVPPMSDHIAKLVRAYGLKGFSDTMAATRLDWDMCGARAYLLDELKKSLTYNHEAVVKYLKSWAFVSLMDSQFFNGFKNLSRPVLTNIELRYPKILLTERQPVTLES